MKNEALRYEIAKKRVGELKEFYGHLAIYITVNAVLVIINIAQFVNDNSSFPWAIFPIFFWGIFGLGWHAFATFGPIKNFFGAEWEVRKINELMEKEEKQKRTQ
jgi:hypothetical protein